MRGQDRSARRRISWALREDHDHATSSSRRPVCVGYLVYLAMDRGYTNNSKKIQGFPADRSLRLYHSGTHVLVSGQSSAQIQPPSVPGRLCKRSPRADSNKISSRCILGPALVVVLRHLYLRVPHSLGCLSGQHPCAHATQTPLRHAQNCFCTGHRRSRLRLLPVRLSQRFHTAKHHLLTGFLDGWTKHYGLECMHEYIKHHLRFQSCGRFVSHRAANQLSPRNLTRRRPRLTKAYATGGIHVSSSHTQPCEGYFS